MKNKFNIENTKIVSDYFKYASTTSKEDLVCCMYNFLLGSDKDDFGMLNGFTDFLKDIAFE